jgi:hypothetical protein
MQFTGFFDLEIESNNEESQINCYLQCEATIEPFRSGKYSGPPESCYPAEGGYAILDRILLDGIDIQGFLSPSTLETIEEAVYSQWQDEQEAMEDDE